MFDINKLSGTLKELYYNGEKAIVTESSRKIYIFPENKIVLKKEINARFTSPQNLNEFDNYKSLAKEDLKYFAKIYGIFKFGRNKFLAQEYVSCNGKITKAKIKQYKKLNKKYNFIDVYLCDYTFFNLAITRNLIKIYDLGVEEIST